MIRLLMTLACVGCVYATTAATAQPVEDRVFAAFDEESIEFDKALTADIMRGSVRVMRAGQQVERTLELPAVPADQRVAMRILATLIVEPVVIRHQDKVRPADPWTRLGSVTIAPAGADAGSARMPIANIAASPSKPVREDPGKATGPAASTDASTQPAQSQSDAAFPATTVAPGAGEIEIMRFVTPFGGPATYTADLTAFAPLLSGQTSLRVWISTWKQPAWKVTLTLAYTRDGAGYRRPVFAQPIFNGEITADRRMLRTKITVPPGLARPRLHVLSTGHATDGAGGDEFISRTHVLRVDGVEVARWRPWSEEGNGLREENPTSGRTNIDGRALWASDLDRSGWNPGRLVEPIRIPLVELTAGAHDIELEVVNIRPKDQSGYGYWRVSAIVVADEPWPSDGGSGPN